MAESLIIKISGTKKKIVAGSSLSLICYTMPQILKKVNTHHFFNFVRQQSTLTTVLVSTVAVTSLVYYYVHVTGHAAHVLETSRKKGISKRRLLKKPEEKFASLKVSLIDCFFFVYTNAQ